MACSVTIVFKRSSREQGKRVGSQQNFLREGRENSFLPSAPAHIPPKETGLPMRFSFLERWLSGIIILHLSPIGFNFPTEPFMTSKRWSDLTTLRRSTLEERS